MKIILPLQKPMPIVGGLASVTTRLSSLGYRPDQWQGDGIEWTPQCDQNLGVWGCATLQNDPLEEKVANSTSPSEVFNSALIYAQANCLGIDRVSPLGDMAQQMAINALEAHKWSQLARVLHEGDVQHPDGPNPSLQSMAEVPVGYTHANIVDPPGLASGVQSLLETVCGCNSADVVLHVPMQYAPQFMKNYLVEWEEPKNSDGMDSADQTDGKWMLGPYEVSFDCYPNVGPVSVESIPGYVAGDRIPDADGSEVWIYLSSRPLGDFGDDYQVDSEFVRTNSRLNEAAQFGVIAVDPCCVVAVKASVNAC